MDIDPEKAFERMKAEAPDRMESAGISFFQKIRQGYHQIMEQNQSRCIVINGEQSQKNVSKSLELVAPNVAPSGHLTSPHLFSAKLQYIPYVDAEHAAVPHRQSLVLALDPSTLLHKGRVSH